MTNFQLTDHFIKFSSTLKIIIIEQYNIKIEKLINLISVF